MRATISTMDDAVRLAAVRMLLRTLAEPRPAPPPKPEFVAALAVARSVDDLCAALDCGRDEAIAMLSRAAAG